MGTLKMPYRNCETNLILTWSTDFVIFSTVTTKFAIVDAKLYVPVVTLWTQDNAKPLQQLEPSFKRKINWNKYQSKTTIQKRNPYLDFLIDAGFQGVNMIFILSFENNDSRKTQTWYFLPKIEIRDHNVMIAGKNIFGHPVRNDIRKYDNILKISNGQGDGYKTGCLTDYCYFKKHKMIVIDLNKHQCWSKSNTIN